MTSAVKTPNRRQKAEAAGRNAERLAELMLLIKGYAILERRYKTKLGEIDLIAQKGGVIAFIEVKHRATLDAALYAVTPTQSRRIQGAASLYMANKWRGANIPEQRFDIIVTGARSWPFSMWPYHVMQAWHA